MHEYGIVRGLLAQIDDLVHGQGGRRAVRVILGVTGATAAEERLLRDAFEAFKADTTAGRAELVLERAPLEVFCLDCGKRAFLPARHGRHAGHAGEGTHGREGTHAGESGESGESTHGGEGTHGREGGRCPDCGGSAALPIRGQDICLKSIEIEV